MVTTIMDKSVDTFEQNKLFLSASFRNFKKHIFLSIANPPLPLSMLQYAPWTLSPGYNIGKGRGVEMSKLDIEELTRSYQALPIVIV